MFRKISAFALAMLVATPAIACSRPGMGDLYRALIAGGDRSWHEPVPVTLPDIDYTDADGNRASLKDGIGKAMIVTFWHPECIGCKIDLPRLDAFLEESPGVDPDQFVQISIERLEEGLRSMSVGTEEVETFLNRKSYANIDVNIDADNEIFNANCLVATPSHLMIDSDGKLTDVLFGPLRWSEPPFVDIARNYLSNY
jgi:thiol-disulfide isomerase/thioredoxin